MTSSQHIAEQNGLSSLADAGGAQQYQAIGVRATWRDRVARYLTAGKPTCSSRMAAHDRLLSLAAPRFPARREVMIFLLADAEKSSRTVSRRADASTFVNYTFASLLQTSHQMGNFNLIRSVPQAVAGRSSSATVDALRSIASSKSLRPDA